MGNKAVQTMIAAAALSLMVVGASAEPHINFQADYVVTVRGFTVARAHFGGKVNGNRFEVDGNLKSAGLARIFDNTNATSRSTGVLAEGTPQPESFFLSYAQGDATGKKMEISFQNGNVANITRQPEIGPPGDDAVPVKKNDLQSVADPVSATIVARGRADDICNRTLRVYEGGTRVDVQLSPVSVGWIYGAGNGAVTCSGQFIPVAGYIKGNTYDYMRQNADMEFIYVPTHRQGLFMLYSISAQTDIGRVKFRAWRHRVSG